jgi:hypothetical protein
MSRAREYRDKAEDYFVLADHVTDTIESHQLRWIAHAFLRLAEHVEGQKTGGPERTQT